ncbi:hypothetical protein Tco_1171332, partial [Tanacetum coccineum]
KYDSESEEESWTFSQDDEDAEEESDKNDDSEETRLNNDGDDLTYPNLSTYKAEDQEEEKADEEEKEEKTNDEEVSSDQKVSTPPDYELTKEEENKEDDDKDKEGKQEEEEDELYRDLNINLERSDAEMTDAQANQDTKDTHVTLTNVPPVVQQQSSSVSSDLVSKFINPSSDIGIDSILYQDTQSDTLINVPISIAAETPFSVTTISQPPIPNIQPLQQTQTSKTTTTNLTMTLPEIPNFASLFQFDQRVSALESEMSKFRQTSQFAEAVSLIPGIFDTYLASKMKEAVDVDSTMKEINKEQVQAQVSKIMPKIEKGRDDQDKDEDPSAGSNRGSKRRRSGKEAELSKEPKNKESKSTSSSKSAFKSQLKSSGKSAHAEEHDQMAADLEDQPHQEFNTGYEDESPARETLNEDVWHRNPSRPPTPDREWHKTKITKAVDYGQVKWIEDKVSRIWSPIKVVYDKHTYWGTYHWGPKRHKFYGYASNMETSKDVYSRHMIITDDQLYKFREGDFKRLRRQDIEDMLLFLVQDKQTNLNLEEWYVLNVALRMFTRRIAIQERVKDLQLGVESYQKKINLKKPDTYRSNLRRMTAYTAYPDIQGIIYVEEMNKNHLMCTDELHKFSDGTLNHVRTALNDIDRGIEMDYLPKRK